MTSKNSHRRASSGGVAGGAVRLPDPDPVKVKADTFTPPKKSAKPADRGQKSEQES